MIAEIREYIRSKILEVDDKLIENQSAFYDEDIGESLLDRSYQITINSGTTVTRDFQIIRTWQVVISIFGFGYRKPIENYDILLDKAVCIEDSVILLQMFTGIETIINIESDGITASKLPSNDDCFQININLTLTQAYTRE